MRDRVYFEVGFIQFCGVLFHAFMHPHGFILFGYVQLHAISTAETLK